MAQLHRLYGIDYSTTMPYHILGNSTCEHFNYTLQSLLRTLPKDQKPIWPDHLGTLVFVYNVTLHATTAYEPYQQMFDCKAQTPCDNWLGLSQYSFGDFTSKTSWVQKQYELVQAVNKWTLNSA